MSTILITGATGFLGYHVAKRLNQQGIRPRVLERPGSALDVLDRLNVERCAGHLDDASAVRSACTGAETLLHLAFKVGMDGGAQAIDDMRRINIEGTRGVLRAAADSGVRRAVVTGSALAVGVNSDPVPLDERAGWSEHAVDLPYALIRREAELDALALATPRFAVLTVCPSFTFGPDDPVGAPANKLVQGLIAGKVPFKINVGFGCLDVRDFADGMVQAAERGRSGERYLLSGDNVTAQLLVDRVAAIAAVRPPRFTAPALLVHGLVAALGLLSKVRGRPAPVSRDVLRIIGRHAWYDTSKARRELGWTPRPLQETLRDTIEWLRAARS
jgi:dihydroflavonol-4-reductase